MRLRVGVAFFDQQFKIAQGAFAAEESEHLRNAAQAIRAHAFQCHVQPQHPVAFPAAIEQFDRLRKASLERVHGRGLTEHQSRSTG